MKADTTPALGASCVLVGRETKQTREPVREQKHFIYVWQPPGRKERRVACQTVTGDGSEGPFGQSAKTSREGNGGDLRTNSQEDPMELRAPGKSPEAGIDALWLGTRNRVN